jgi:hypothetical protein
MGCRAMFNKPGGIESYDFADDGGAAAESPFFFNRFFLGPELGGSGGSSIDSIRDEKFSGVLMNQFAFSKHGTCHARRHLGRGQKCIISTSGLYSFLHIVQGGEGF